VEDVLCFLWRDMSDRTVLAFGVVPTDPLQCFPFNLSNRSPRPEEVDHLGLEKADDAFGQGIVTGIPGAADRLGVRKAAEL